MRERSIAANPEQRARVEIMIADLQRSVVPGALAVGDEVPEVELTEAASGSPFSLHEACATGPVVLSFYRGEWCPYCNVEARALDREQAAFRDLGASVYLIGPETHEHALKMQEKTGATIPILFDVSGAAMDAFGISFELPEVFREGYQQRMGFPERNSATGWRLPIPATYIVGTDRRVLFRHLDPDYTRRVEPAELLAVLRQLP
jgi:peroxiredoxin